MGRANESGALWDVALSAAALLRYREKSRPPSAGRWSEGWTEGEQKGARLCIFFSFFFPWRGDFLEHQGFNPRAKSESDLIRVSVTGHSQL